MNGPISQPLRACVWMIGAIFSFTAMAVAGRELGTVFDTFEIMLYRSLLGVVIVLVAARMTGTLDEIGTAQMQLHLVRNIFHFAGQNLWFLAITLIPLAQVFALEFTSPIWAMLLAVVVLGERLTRMRVITALVGFGGILIITQPWQSALSTGVVAAALAAIGFAGSAVFTRALTRRQSVTNILFWLTVMQSVFALVLAGYDGTIRVPDLVQWPWLALVAVGGLVAHFCLTKALSLAPAAVVVPVDFARLPVIALVGLLFYNEPLQGAVIIGALIIFGANYANILAESRQSRA